MLPAGVDELGLRQLVAEVMLGGNGPATGGQVPSDLARRIRQTGHNEYQGQPELAGGAG